MGAPTATAARTRRRASPRQVMLPFTSIVPQGSRPVPHRPSVLRRLKPTIVFDTYWHFAAERQAIFQRRASGRSFPWTDDPILRQYRFTNAYRASDRVSQYLIQHVIYDGEQSPNEVFFRTLLFKLFNKIETWELLVKHFGLPTTKNFDVDRYGLILSNEIEARRAIYSAAYIMPSGPKASHSGRKHEFHLRLLSEMLKSSLPQRIADVNSLKAAYDLLLSCPSVGPFLAYQFAIDLNYSEIMHADEMEFVVAGPGALDGISKCFAEPDASPADIIRMVTEHQSDEFKRLGLDFRDLWGRPLQLIDCQNIFCEISKYSRVRHPEVTGIAKRTRIKQKYRPTHSPVGYWFPPKWNLNHKVCAGASIDG